MGGVGFFALGAGLLPCIAAGILSAFVGAGFHQAYENRIERTALRKAMDELQSQFVYLHQRQGQSEARVDDVSKSVMAAPASAMHATAMDMEVIGQLISDLAKTVAEHDRKFSQQIDPTPLIQTAHPAPAPVAAPSRFTAPLPEEFENEAELGFTADLPAMFEAQVVHHVAPSAEVLKELKTTLSSALSSNRLELCLQPIVMLPQRKASGYEASLRLKGGSADVQHDANLRRIAAATGLETELDKALFSRAVQVLRILRSRNRDAGLSCAVSMASILDRNFRTQVEDLTRNDEKIARAITLELDHADLRLKGAEGREAVASFSRIGIGLGASLSEHLRFDVSELVTLGMRQLRVPASLMQEAIHSGGRVADIHPADVAELLQRNNIMLLVDGVTTEEIVREMLDYAAPQAQGDLFGAVRAVRAEVLEPKAVGEALQKDAGRSGQPEKTPASGRVQRQSFRSLLRRA